MIQIRWASTDLSALATHPLYPGANPTNTEEDYLMQHTRKANLQGRAGSSGYYPNDSGGGSPPSSSSSGSGSGSGSGSSPGSGSDHGNGDSGGSGGGLSTGAKVGIGLGVSVSAIFGFTILGLIIWRVRTSSKRAKQFQTPQQPYMVPSQYAGQPPGPGPSPEQHYGGQQPPSQPQPAYQQQNTQPQHQHYPSMSEMGNNTSAANSHWATNSVTPPPAVAVAAERGIGSVTGTGGSSIGSPELPPSELAGAHLPNTPIEMGSGSPAVHPAQPAAVAQPQSMPRSASADPQSFVAVPSEEPSAEELSNLRQQHSQLEQRRQRILELERIEQEQETLRNRMSQMQDGQK